jgi:hypothetical protein
MVSVAGFDKLYRVVYIFVCMARSAHLQLHVMQQWLLIECRGAAK